MFFFVFMFFFMFSWLLSKEREKEGIKLVSGAWEVSGRDQGGESVIGIYCMSTVESSMKIQVCFKSV